MKYCGFIAMRMSVLWTVWLIVLSKSFPYKSYTSMSSNVSFFAIFICLLAESFWQLRFVEDLTKTHYWLFRLTILKSGDVFFHRTLAGVIPTGHWVCYWVYGLFLKLNTKTCQSEHSHKK